MLLVDCDMRQPAVASLTGLRPGNDLHNALSLRDVLADNLCQATTPVVHKLDSGLEVIPTGSGGRHSQDLLVSQRMEHLIQNARENYDLIVLDTPPVLAVADALVVSRLADATIFVVRWEKTSRAVARSALKMLRGAGAQVLGGVLTQVNLRKYGTSSASDVAGSYRKFRRYHLSES